MLKKEAIWIGKEIKMLKVNEVLDISGGSFFFRNIRQPWIEKYIFKNFKDRKINVKRTDCRNDVCSKDFMQLGKYDLVFANNLLEHVGDIKKAVKNISLAVKMGGYLCVSVPYVFPYHPDPIDNMFRPNLKELEALFPKFKVISGEEVKEFKMFSLNRQSLFWINKTFIASCLVLKKI